MPPLKAASAVSPTSADYIPVEYDIYKHRWHVLVAYGLSYMAWCWAASRYVVIATTAASYHDTTNQVSLSQSELGIDFITISSNLGVILSYLPAAFCIDKYGLKWTSLVGNLFVCTLVGWAWYFAGSSWGPVVWCSFLGNIMGTFQTATILAISNRWFPARERAMAVAIGSFFGALGFAIGVIAAGFFATGEPDTVDMCLKSCLITGDEYFYVGNATLVPTDVCVEGAAINKTWIADPWDWRSANCPSFNNTGLECSELARANFCCITPTNIPSYSLFLAILLTATTIYSFLVTEDYPPKPPGPAGEKKKSESFWVTTKHCFSKRNFWQTIIAEFIIAAPILVAYATMDRILPASIYHLKWLLGIFAFALMAPLTFYVGRTLDKHRNYYEVTSGCHLCGLVSMTGMWLGYEIGGDLGGILVFVTIGFGTSFMVAWQTAEYEVKMEYAFTEMFNIEGTVVGYDRFFFNLCSALSLAVLAPENFPCPNNVNALRCFEVMTLIGFMVYQFVPDKRQYNRKKFEARARGGFKRSVKEGKMEMGIVEVEPETVGDEGGVFVEAG